MVPKRVIFNKSKTYILKGLRAKEASDFEEYLLWASLALELLGKSVLANIHPSLIADPQHSASLFAASRVLISADVKTITCNTLFERLAHISYRFDTNVKKFCNSIAQRRNAELHSGELSLKAINLDVWEKKYWHAAQILLECMEFSLESWLGANEAKAPKEIIKHASQACISAALIKVEKAKENFLSKPKKEQKTKLKEASTKYTYHYSRLFNLLADQEWEVVCPACTGRAFLAGMLHHEEVIDEFFSTYEEEVVQDFLAEEFHCPVCDLHLYSYDEIEAVGLETNHTETSIREREYAPEYGND